MTTYPKILLHSAAYSIPIVLGKLGSFFMLPLYTRYLSPANYGVLELLDLTSFVLSSLVGVKLVDALFCYYSEAPTAEERHRIVTTAFVTACLLGAAGAIIGLSSSKLLSHAVFQTGQYSRCYQLVFANFFLIFPQEIGLGFLRVTNRSGLLVFLQVLRLAVSILLNILFLVVFSMGIYSLLWSSLCGSVVLVLVLLITAIPSGRFQFSGAISWKLVRYAIPAGISGVGMLVIHYGDRFFLQRAATLTDVGLYSVAYKIGMLVSYVQLPFATYWNAQMYALVRTPDGQQMYIRVCTYFTLVLTAAAVLLSVFSRPLLALLTTSAYQGTAVFIPAIAAVYVIRGIGDQFRNVFFLEKRTDLDARVSTAGVIVCLLGYVLLIPRYKAWGAIAATAAAFVVMAIYSFWQAQRTRHFKYDMTRMFKIGLSAGVTLLIPEVLPAGGIARSLAIGAGSFVLFGLLLLLLGFLDEDEIGRLQSLRHRIGERLGMISEPVRF